MRSRTWDRLKYEIEYSLQKGTTANSYLIQGDKTALIDPPGESFTKIFLNALQQRIDPKTIEYVILGHVNANRGATLKALLELAPQITFVCSNPGAIALRQLFEGKEIQISIVRSDETLDLGKGHELRFVPIPSPRWPDGLCTYDPQTKVLFTDKLFGAHTCGDQVFDEGWAVYREDRRFYFDCLHASQAQQVETALERMARWQPIFYAPGHGPLVRYGLQELTNSYREWTQQQKTKEFSVALIYASAYGNTASISHAIARGLSKGGARVDLINCELSDPAEIKTAVEQCAGFIIGSPTLGGHAPTQIQTALGTVISAAAKNKLAGVFGSFGWSGEAIDYLETKLKDAGYKLGFEPIRVNFKPTDATLQFCEEVGTDFAQALKKSQKLRRARSPQGSIADRTEQAVGRVVGSYCVLTAKRGEVTSAMLASWVTQASFTPPGITVAVAKDRAVESLMYQGDKFVLNILAEGRQVRRQFAKVFQPGEDRFANLPVDETDYGFVIRDALAYLECAVEQRMECGDHWLVYAVARNGGLLEPNGITAVHYRKSGTYY